MRRSKKFREGAPAADSTDDALWRAELETLRRLIYRSSTQHRSSPLLRHMVQLHRLATRDAPRERIAGCARGLYAICSTALVRHHFVLLNACAMAVAARISYLAARRPAGGGSAIDRIFAG